MRTSYVVRGRGKKGKRLSCSRTPPPPLKGAVVYREEESNDREDKTAVLCAMLLTFPPPRASRNRTIPSCCIAMHSPLHAAYSRTRPPPAHHKLPNPPTSSMFLHGRLGGPIPNNQTTSPSLVRKTVKRAIILTATRSSTGIPSIHH